MAEAPQREPGPRHVMSPEEYARCDALELASLVAQGSVSAQELLETAISLLESLNPALNAITQRLYDHARSALAAGLPQGPFQGIPFLLKDAGNLLTGTPTYNGSCWFDDWPADHDSTLTARFKSAGLVIFGKTAAPELGLSVSTESQRFGLTRNPWNPQYTTGGSSGGAAAAVAAGIVPVAHATDGGGSIRIPASCCGLFGMKPTRGRVPQGPDRGEAWSGLAVQHALTRSVQDSAALLDAVSGAEPGDPYACPPSPVSYLAALERPPEPMRIGFSTLAGVPVHSDCLEAMLSAAKLCEELGHIVEEASPPVDNLALFEPFLDIAAANTAGGIEEASRLLQKPYGPQDFEPVTWAMIERGKAKPMLALVMATNAIHRAGRLCARFHARYDAFLCPTLAEPPQPLHTLHEWTGNDLAQAERTFRFSPYTAVANMTGQPSMSVPLHWNTQGLPIGVMFTAAFGAEHRLFALAAQMEQARPWKHRYPPVHPACPKTAASPAR